MNGLAATDMEAREWCLWRSASGVAAKRSFRWPRSGRRKPSHKKRGRGLATPPPRFASLRPEAASVAGNARGRGRVQIDGRGLASLDLDLLADDDGLAVLLEGGFQGVGIGLARDQLGGLEGPHG